MMGRQSRQMAMIFVDIRYRVTDSRKPPAAEDRADGILWLHLWSFGAILSSNRPSICRPCQYVQNALDRIPVWHQIRAAVGGGSSAQHRLPMVLRIWTGWHNPKSLHIQQDQNTKMAAERSLSESLLWNSQAMYRQRLYQSRQQTRHRVSDGSNCGLQTRHFNRRWCISCQWEGKPSGLAAFGTANQSWHPNEPACSGSRIWDGRCSPRAGASGHYRIYPRNSVLQSTWEIWILLRSTARRIHLSGRSSSYIPQAKLQQIDGQISALLPSRGRCLYALSKTAELFWQGWNSAQSAGQQLLSGIFQRASARGNSRIPGHDAAS